VPRLPCGLYDCLSLWCFSYVRNNLHKSQHFESSASITVLSAYYLLVVEPFQADRYKLEAFEMWIWKRMEKISWVDRKSNEDFCIWFKKIKKKILNNMYCININGWVVCVNDGLLCDLLEGRMLGKRTRGRRRIQLIEDLLEKKNYTDLKKAAEDRSVWRTIRRDFHEPSSRAITQ